MQTPLSLNFAPGRLPFRHSLIIIAFGLLVLLPASWPAGITLSAHEVLAAQPAREMLRDGYWLIQHYAGVPRYEKPPTASWLIAASMALFRTDAVWAVRLPSVLAAIAAAVVIAALAARWLGSLAGLLAGLIQLTTVWVLTQANLAEADIHLVLWMSVSMWLFALGNVDHPLGVISATWVRRAFMASLGVLFQFKGPIPLLFALLACALWIVLSRRWKAWRFLADPIGIGILVALLLAWPVAALISDPQIWGMWQQEVFGYAGAETFGRKSPSLYVLNIPLMLMPWTLLLIPLAIAAKRRGWFGRPFALLLICWFVPGMCILQLAAFKSTHYAFPLLPPFSIAMAAGLMLWTASQQQRAVINRRVIAAVIVVAAVAGMVAIGTIRPQLPASLPAILCVIAVGLLFTLWLEHRRELTKSFVALFETIGMTLVLVDLLVLPAFKTDRAALEFSARVNQRIGADRTLYLVDVGYDEIVWHLSVPLKRIDDVKEFEQLKLPQVGVYAITRQRALAELQSRYLVSQLDQLSEPRRKIAPGTLPMLVLLTPVAPASEMLQPATAPTTQVSGRATPK